MIEITSHANQISNEPWPPFQDVFIVQFSSQAPSHNISPIFKFDSKKPHKDCVIHQDGVNKNGRRTNVFMIM